MLRLKILASVVPLAILALYARGELLGGPRPCIAVAGTTVQIAALSWQADQHVGFTVIDDVDMAEPGACEGGAPPRLIAISRQPSETDPVIYLSRDGPADYRIFVASKSFSLLDAAALLVGARGDRHRVQAAAL